MPGRVLSGPFGVTARRIIQAAYHLTEYQLSGGPGWLDSDRFELEAKAQGRASNDQLRLMLQTLLAERFKLMVHRGTKAMSIYAVTIGRNGLGPNLHELKDGEPAPPMPANLGSSRAGPTMTIRGSMRDFAFELSGSPFNFGRPVLDKTGLQGVYIGYLHWDDDEDAMHALQLELGLKFESQKTAVDIVVIDSIEKPDAN